jgi:hypothetical protein
MFLKSSKTKNRNCKRCSTLTVIREMKIKNQGEITLYIFLDGYNKNSRMWRGYDDVNIK